MQDFMSEVKSPLFDGMDQGDRQAVLSCVGYHVDSFSKGEIVALEGENLKHIGIILSGSVVSAMRTACSRSPARISIPPGRAL